MSNLSDRHKADEKLKIGPGNELEQDAAFSRKAAAWRAKNSIKPKRKIGMRVGNLPANKPSEMSLTICQLRRVQGAKKKNNGATINLSKLSATLVKKSPQRQNQLNRESKRMGLQVS